MGSLGVLLDRVRGERREGSARIGDRGERVAARMLRRKGYAILGRNVRVPMGEADLVCLDPDRRTVVLIEVKARVRRAGAIGGSRVAPEANVHEHKRRKLLRIARFLRRANRWEGRPFRIDVVAVEWPGSVRGRPILRHHRSAVGQH